MSSAAGVYMSMKREYDQKLIIDRKWWLPHGQCVDEIEKYYWLFAQSFSSCPCPSSAGRPHDFIIQALDPHRKEISPPFTLTRSYPASSETLL